MTTLTAKQNDVYGYLRSHVREHGYPPTVREIGDRFEIASPNGVLCHLRALKKKGWIDWDALKSRSIRLLKEPKEGQLRTLDGGIEDFSDLFQEGNTAALTTKGVHLIYRGSAVVGFIRRIP